MATEQEPLPEIEDEGSYEELQELMSRHSLLSLFQHLTFREKVAKVMEGLKAPKDSGDYKYARLQVQRLSAPALALLVPILLVLSLSFLAAMQPEREREVVVQVIDPTEVEDLDIMEDMEDPIEPPDPIDKDIYGLPPEEKKDIAQTPGNLAEAVDALEADHDFLLKGDVFTADLIEAYIGYKRAVDIDGANLRPHPYEFELYYDI